MDGSGFSTRVAAAVCETTVKPLALVAVPPGVVTPIAPVVAPPGTVASIVVADLTMKVALTPLKVTAVASVKFVPLIVTLVPTGPLVGVKLVIVGGLVEALKVTVLSVLVEAGFPLSAAAGANTAAILRTPLALGVIP